jgi:signal transduction histidine kinase
MARIKIGLQVKSALVLAVVVLSATAAGGWLYYAVTQAVLSRNDRHQAERLVTELCLAAEPDLLEQDRPAVQKLVGELARLRTVRHVAVLDAKGQNFAYAEKVSPDGAKPRPTQGSPSLSYDLTRENFMEIGRPVISGQGQSSQIRGAVRLIVDTSDTLLLLAGLRRQIATIAAIILLCVIPLGQLLAWRVLVVPVRKLLRGTRQLAGGDFSARSEMCRNDEIGELASAFDHMAEKLHESRQQLCASNDSLERKVQERTAELERANGRLRQEMAEKEDFLRAVSHDLGAPLRNIAGIATLIGYKWKDELPEEVLSRLQRIQVNADAEMGLISELLELSRIRTRPQVRSWVDFGELFAELEGAFEFELKQKGMTLSIEGPMPRLYVEHNRMRQLFQNLIDNAIKYMGDCPDGRIHIACRGEDGCHVFSVSDNGPGVAPEERERIFHVFRRALSARAASVPGRGIGLAVVKSIAANYDGRAWVEQSGMGGARFNVALSAAATQGSADAPAKSPETTDGQVQVEAAAPAAPRGTPARAVSSTGILPVHEISTGQRPVARMDERSMPRRAAPATPQDRPGPVQAAE